MPPSTASAHDDSGSDDVGPHAPPTPQKHHSAGASSSHHYHRRAPTPTHASTASSESESESSAQAHHADAQRAADAHREQEQLARERESSEAAAMKKTGWLLLRSTARNLTNVLRHIGAPDLRAVQLFDNAGAPAQPPLAFIMLYKWSPDRGDRVSWNPEHVRNHDASHSIPLSAYEEHSDNSRRDVLFVGQTMDNAAATQAVVLALLNIHRRDEGEMYGAGSSQRGGSSSAHRPVNVGEQVQVLHSFLEPLDPVLRSAAVSSSASVRDAHNRAAREQFGGHPDLLDEDGKVRSSLLADELWMYSVFVPAREGTVVYEMRGMADGAYLLDYCDEKEPDDWINVVYRTVDERIETFRMHNVPFSLFSIVHDPENDVSTSLRQTGRPPLFRNREPRGRSESDSGGDDDWRNGAPDEMVNEEMERIAATHNYETFFVEMLKLLASKGEINALIRDRVTRTQRGDRMDD